MRKYNAIRLLTINFAILFILGGFTNSQACPLSVVTPTYSFPTAVCAGQTITVTWTSDCPTTMMQVSLISQPPLAFQVVQNYSSLPNTGSYSFTVPASALPGTYNFFIADNGVTAWNYGAMFTVKPAPGLPVEMKDFAASQKDDSSIELVWVTETETNNHGFEVEHSADGIAWEVVHFLAGNQLSTEKRAYNFIHDNPFFGSNYYRLKQIDVDGSFSYSNTLLVEFSIKSQIDLKIYPNPSTNSIQVPIKFKGQALWAIYSAAGLKVGSGVLTDDGIQIAYLIQGKYHLVVTNSGRQIYSTFLKL